MKFSDNSSFIRHKKRKGCGARESQINTNNKIDHTLDLADAEVSDPGTTANAEEVTSIAKT